MMKPAEGAGAAASEVLASPVPVGSEAAALMAEATLAIRAKNAGAGPSRRGARLPHLRGSTETAFRELARPGSGPRTRIRRKGGSGR